MNLPAFDTNDLSEKLRPYVEGAFRQLSDFADDVAVDLSKKAAGGVSSTALSALRSLGSAAWLRIKSSKAQAAFNARWSSANSAKEKEEAIRLLLETDPKLASSLHSLLLKRDFVRATIEYCEHLPRIGAIDHTRRLSEIFVPLSIDRMEGRRGDTDLHQPPDRNETQLANGTTDTSQLLKAGNHLIEAVGGSGKSTLIQHLIISECQRLLADGEKASFDQLRLPVFVNAKTLCEAKLDFASSLVHAINRDMAFTATAAIPNEFFTPYSDAGHSSWLIAIDALDEVADPHERQRLWDSIAEVHSQSGNSFRFLVTTRPDSIRFRESSSFTRWCLRRLTAAGSSALARKYIDTEYQADEFLKLVDQTGYSDIKAVPLFEAIAASVYLKTGTLPKTKLELCNEFAFSLAERRLGLTPDKYDSLAKALMELSADPTTDVSKFLAEPTTKFGHVTPLFSVQKVRDDADGLICRSGLVRKTGKTFYFIHDVFRSYFLALRLARMHEPSRDIWKTIDPFVVGWTTVEYLCEAWAQSGKEISEAVDHLLSFGDAGETCATEIAISISTVNDKVIERIVERHVREMFSTGPTISAERCLSRLARSRVVVKKRLIDLAFGDRDFLGSKLTCAECLLAGGHRQEALEALSELAKSDCYYGDRVQAAEILLRNEHESLAIEVLQMISQEGDQLWVRAEAARILFEHSPNPITRRNLRRTLKDDGRDRFDCVYDTTLAKLLSKGETALVLPLLRKQAKLPRNNRGAFPGLVREQIDAAKAIALHNDHSEGVSALRTLIKDKYVSVRGKAEVLEALAEIGEETEAAQQLQQLISDPSNLGDYDWFVLQTLIDRGLEKEAKEVGMHLIRVGLAYPQSNIEITDITERLLHVIDRAELAKYFKQTIELQRPRTVTSLAIVGLRDEATRLLKIWLDGPNMEWKIDSAVALSALGERDAGIRVLEKLVKSTTISVKDRFAAAFGLERMSEDKAADRAYEHLLRDARMPIEDRCRAGDYFDNDGVYVPDKIWKMFVPFMHDKTNSLKDRAVAAIQLLSTDEDERYDYFHDEVLDDLYSMLESEVISPTDARQVLERAKLRLSSEDYPDLFSLLKSASRKRTPR
jgi:tetratricopeptide (TPR) repeat protein